MRDRNLSKNCHPAVNVNTKRGLGRLQLYMYRFEIRFCRRCVHKSRHRPPLAYRRVPACDADCCDRCVLTSIKSTLSRKNTLPLALCVNLRGGGGPATAMRHRAQPGARLWGYRGFKNTRGAGTYTPTHVVSLGLSSGAWSLRPTPQGGAYRIPNSGPVPVPKTQAEGPFLTAAHRSGLKLSPCPRSRPTLTSRRSLPPRQDDSLEGRFPCGEPRCVAGLCKPQSQERLLRLKHSA